MGLAASKGGLLFVDTINVVMTERIAGIAFEDGGHELHVPGHGLYFYLSPKGGTLIAKVVGVIRRGGRLDFLFVQRTHEDIGHKTKEAVMLT